MAYREVARQGGRDHDGVGSVAAAESGLHHDFTLDVIRRDNTQHRAGLKDVAQVLGNCEERFVRHGRGDLTHGLSPGN
ncbi:hypothetical protein ACFC09_44085 [Streptomyces sp. NPDC056161]|uniref:hypothetical protein n=1 Tax=Streptomyces sp. NPDC056161 TaxID=3345732 RepID=UPI0035E05CB1